MHAWQIVLAAALPAAAASLSLSICVVWLLRSYGWNSKHDTSPPGDRSERASARTKKLPTYPGVLRSGNARDSLGSSVKQSNRVASVWRANYPIKVFNWSEHPALVAEAVEHGWATFAFTYTHIASPIPPKLWDLCTGCSQIEPCEPEISWEVGSGTDYMQKMRLNPALSSRRASEITTVQALQTSLPLPGPPLGVLSFPQEAYFEVTILAESQEYVFRSFNENENAKLISPRLSAAKGFSSDARSVYGNDSNEKREAVNSNGAEEEGRKSSEQEEDDAMSIQAQASEAGKKESDCSGVLSAASEQLQAQVCAVGVAAGGAPPFRLPGCDPGSVGFLSTGQVLLNGQELPKSATSSRQRSWGSINTTVGCGFDPAARKIIFTLNGDSVLEMRIPNDLGEYFDHPLFPTVAANSDITLSANFGQTPFDYAPANNSRIPDPCFRRPPSKTAQYPGGVEDSADLFSMGRINSQWLADLAPSPSRGHDLSPGPQLLPHHPAISETEAETDLFEIVLDSRSSS